MFNIVIYKYLLISYLEVRSLAASGKKSLRLTLPVKLYEKLQKLADETGFASPTAAAVYIINLYFRDEEQKKSPSSSLSEELEEIIEQT